MHSDTYQLITDRIIAALEAGTVPWRKPWASAGAPRNYDGRPYRGINAFLLALANFELPVYLTYRRAAELGGHVKKGEHAIPVIFWKFDRQQDPTAVDDTQTRTLVMARTYHVFNVAQTEGIPPEKLPTLPSFPAEPIVAAEAIQASMPHRPNLNRGAHYACYNMLSDTVNVPYPERFPKPEEYYATLFHELGHSTGHPSRLNRKELTAGAHFSTVMYSREELTAEMTAAFLCAEAGITPATIENAASYVAGWLPVLKQDSRAVIVAAAQAQRAADFILNRAPQPHTTVTDTAG